MTISISSTLADIKSAKTSDLLAFYNTHRKPILKFRDRASAEQRTADLIQELAKTASSAAFKPVPANPVVEAATTAPKNPKTHVEFIRDHSGSMYSLRGPALNDYNNTLNALNVAASDNGIATTISVTECGGGIRHAITNVPIGQAQPLTHYNADGGTPLFRSVLAAIKNAKNHPHYNDPEFNIIIAATTDGQDTNGGQDQMMNEIRALQATDRWTFVFRVPRGYGRELVRLGVAPGNILEWDQTAKGTETASVQNNHAFSEFMQGVKSGQRSSRTFYTSAANVTEADVKKLGDISSEVQLFPVSDKEADAQIRDFVESRLNGSAMLKGAAFYQLVKTEDKIQDYKLVAIRDKDSGQIYCGPEARDLIGLPRLGDARVRPDTAGKWQIFVQSTSVNRKVTGNTQVLYWPAVGKRFTEGKSSR
jgi:hypothetical protein